MRAPVCEKGRPLAGKLRTPKWEWPWTGAVRRRAGRSRRLSHAMCELDGDEGIIAIAHIATGCVALGAKV